MALPVPGTGTDRMQAITKIAVRGPAACSPPDSEIGAWKFSTHLDGQGTDYREAVSVGPLTENVDGVLRKDLLTRHLATIQAKATGDTGLNDTPRRRLRAHDRDLPGRQDQHAAGPHRRRGQRRPRRRDLQRRTSCASSRSSTTRPSRSAS